MAYNRRETIKATAEWQREQNYTHFATATFEYGNNFSEEQVLKTLRYFFNAIDRTIYTHKGINKGKRVERMVYLERGRGRDNLHIHFFFKGTDDKEAELISQIATELWQNKIHKSHSIKILPNTSKDNRNGYGMKEHYFADDDNFVAELSVINTLQ